MNLIKNLQIIFLFTLLVSSCSRNRTVVSANNTNNEMNKQKMDNTPQIIEAYNKTVIDSYSLWYKTDWKKWLVEDDNSVEGYTSFTDYSKESMYEIVFSEQQKLLQVNNSASGAGEESIGMYELFDNDDKTIYLFLHKSATPEWLDIEKKLIVFNKKTTNTKVIEQISVLPLKINMFFKPNLDIKKLETHQVISLNLNYNSNDKSIEIEPFISYVFNCNDKNNIANITEEERDDICNQLSKMQTKKITLNWNKEKQLFEQLEQTSYNIKLLGKWHSEPVVSAGLSFTYTFYSNNTYVDRAPEGSTNKLRYIKGNYSINNGKIELQPLVEGIVEGEKMTYLEHVGDSVLEGGEIIEYSINKEPIEYTISEVKFIEEYNNDVVEINGSKWFRISNNEEEEN